MTGRFRVIPDFGKEEGLQQKGAVFHMGTQAIDNKPASVRTLHPFMSHTWGFLKESPLVLLSLILPP